ncbi:BREX system P-loop protein BrxC, partial [Vibrio parahaemolyticus]
PCFDSELPKDAAQKIYLWVQDGWSTSEASFHAEARGANPDLPTIYLFIPARNRSELTNAIIAQKAADLTLELRGVPSTEAGTDARKAMETRLRDADKQVELLLKEILAGVQVLQAGGAEAQGTSVAACIEKAAQASMVRLFREFDLADNVHWGKVYDRARKDGGQNALEALGYNGEPEKQPV